MKALMGNTSVPNYVKITSTALLAVTYLAALALAVDTYWQHGTNANLPTVVTFILGTGMGMAVSAIGLHQGVSVAESSPATTTTVTTTPPPAPSVTVTTGGQSNASTPTT